LRAEGEVEHPVCKTTQSPRRWIDLAIRIGAGFFIFALLLSAVFDPKIRLLHVLQALIYIVVSVLTGRQSPFGFGAGFAIAVLWNYTNLVITSFITEGMRFLWLFVQTGRLKHPDLLVAVVAAAGHFAMIGVRCRICSTGSLQERLAAVCHRCRCRRAVFRSNNCDYRSTIHWTFAASVPPVKLWDSVPRRLQSKRNSRIQIQFLLGHVSIQTTERYLGCKQKLRVAVNDKLGLESD